MSNVHNRAVRGKIGPYYTKCSCKPWLKRQAWGRFRAFWRDCINKGIDPDECRRQPRALTDWEIE